MTTCFYRLAFCVGVQSKVARASVATPKVQSITNRLLQDAAPSSAASTKGLFVAANNFKVWRGAVGLGRGANPTILVALTQVDMYIYR